MNPITPDSPITSRLRGSLAGVVAVLLLFAGFLLGRRSSSPDAGGTEVRAEDKEAETSRGAAEEDKHQEGVIRFTPLALSRAGVRVTPVTLSAVRADLQVTGTIEPNIA